MKPDFQLQKAAERQDIIDRATKVGVKARPSGKYNVEITATELGNLVDQRQRYEDLLIKIAQHRLPEDISIDVQNALAGR